MLSFFKDIFSSWYRCNPSTAGAAIAYYALFSFPPIIVIAIAIAGSLISPAVIQGKVLIEFQSFMGIQGAEIVKSIVQSIYHSPLNIVATIFSAIMVLIGSIGIFSQLQETLNHLWDEHPEAPQGIMSYILSKFASFAMVFLVGFLVVFSLIMSTFAELVNSFIQKHIHLGPIASVVPLFTLYSTIFSYIITCILFILIFAVLPERRISRSALIIGGIITALLFIIGRELIGWYLTISSIASAYGAASAIIAVLIWAYYSSQVILLGAALTHAIDVRMKKA